MFIKDIEIMARFTVENVDFSNQTDSIVGIFISVTVGVLVMAFAIFTAIREKSVIFIFMGLFISSMLSLSIFMVSTIFSSTVPENQIENFQAWASETYLVDMNDDDAKNVLYNQIDVTGNDNPESKQDTQKTVTMTDAYGDLVKVGLVLNGDNWVLTLLKDSAVRTK